MRFKGEKFLFIVMLDDRVEHLSRSLEWVGAHVARTRPSKKSESNDLLLRYP